MKQEMVRKIMSGIKWISSIDVHPQGDNVLIGGYDKKVCWFDLEWGSTPYKTLKYHRYAVRNVTYHKRYPLFCSCSDDGTIQVFHGMVYNDMLENPLIVPVKILKGHDIVDHLGKLSVSMKVIPLAYNVYLGILHTEFHPTQPWLMSSGADGTMKLFT
jgi:ribosome biogenesis protein ERB1